MTANKPSPKTIEQLRLLVEATIEAAKSIETVRQMRTQLGAEEPFFIKTGHGNDELCTSIPHELIDGMFTIIERCRDEELKQQTDQLVKHSVKIPPIALEIQG